MPVVILQKTRQEMITDQETNTLFLADCLPKKYSAFFKSYKDVLSRCEISFQLIPQTKDIWAVDYMPIQVRKDKFIQFTYNPDYLQSKYYQKTISNVDEISKAINLQTERSTLVVDGGNIIRSKHKVIMCDKVFDENPLISKRDLIKKLKQLFEVDELYFIPWEKEDFTGHADGIVRFLDTDTVLINDYKQEAFEYKRNLKMALHNAGLKCIEIPCYPSQKASHTSAKGFYINYLQMQQAIILPIFNCEHDEEAVKVFENLFPGQTVATVNANEIARKGGILNCISWNIKVSN